MQTNVGACIIGKPPFLAIQETAQIRLPYTFTLFGVASAVVI